MRLALVFMGVCGALLFAEVILKAADVRVARAAEELEAARLELESLRN